MPGPRMDFFVITGGATKDVLDAYERYVNCEFTEPTTPPEELAVAIELNFGLNIGSSEDNETWAEYDGDIDITPVTNICERNNWTWRIEVRPDS